MTDDPNKPPPLEYAPPVKVSQNKPAKVFGRILLGTVAAIVSLWAGSFLMAITNIPFIIYAPPAANLGLFIYIAVRYRRFGYVTGFVFGPFLVVVSIGLLLLAICAASGFK